MPRALLLALSGLLLAQPAAAMTVQEYYWLLKAKSPLVQDLTLSTMKLVIFRYGTELPELPQAVRDCVSYNFGNAGGGDMPVTPGIVLFSDKVLMAIIEDTAYRTALEELMLEAVRETCPLTP